MIVLYIFLGIIALIVILLHFSVCAYVKGDKKGVEIKVRYMFFNIYPRTKKTKQPLKKNKKKSDENKAPPMEINEENEKNYSEVPSPEEIPIEELMKMEPEEILPDEPQIEEFEDNQQSESQTIHTDELNESNESDKAEKSVKEESEKSPEISEEEISLKNGEENKPKEKSKGKFEDIKNKYERIKPYIPMGWKYFKKLLKTIRITHIKLNMTVGKDDAYESAMLYGKIQGGVFGLLGIISGIFTVTVDEANINCVFDKKTFDFCGETTVKIRPSAMIAIAVCLGVNFLRIWLPQRYKEKKAKKKAITAEQ